ncbi:CHASE2 domain-containing protein [Thermodesulfobacteriota bacterium]
MSTNKRHNFQITFLLILGAFLAARLCFWLLPNLFEMWDAKAIDRFFLFRSSAPHFQPSYDNTIVHVDITDTSLKQLKTFYLDRSHHARVIKNLAEMNVSAQMHDFIFAARMDRVEDRLLTKATENAANVYFGMAFNLGEKKEDAKDQQIKGGTEDIPYLERTGWNVVVDGDPNGFYQGTDPLVTFPELASVSRGLGFLNLKTDPDGVNRRIPLLVMYKGVFFPSFAFRGICDYLNVSPEKIIIKPGKSITLEDAKRPGGSSGHNIIIPIDQHGNMLINFIGPWERMQHYNFADIFYASDDRNEMEMWSDELTGKIALISEVTTGAADLGPVPTDPYFLSSGIHASILHTILQDSFLTDLSETQDFIIEGILLIILFLFSLRFSSLFFTLGTLFIATSYIGVAGASFLYGNLIFPIVRPLLIITFAAIVIVIFRFIKEERERHFIHSTFGRYLSEEVVDELLNSPLGLEMSGESRQVTFLVSDLRGFTSISDKLSPHDVIQILNHYFERMVKIIARYRGTVDELQGDGILVFFGAPLSADDDPERAVACAIEMQSTMPEINRAQRQKNLPQLSMGIAINTGEVVVGNIGSEKRTKYGAVGTPINTTYRIESHTVGGQILISHGTYEKIRAKLKVRETFPVQFKGIEHPVTLYDVAGIQGKYPAFLPEEQGDKLTDLKTPLLVSCFTLEGKEVSEKSIHGQIIRLSLSGADVLLQGEIQLRSNLKFLFHTDTAQHLSEVYAKVMIVESSACQPLQSKVRLKFTSLPQDTKIFIGEKLGNIAYST